MKNIRISWIIPVYNSGAFLTEALESILNCPCADIVHEILLINDCSTDAVTIELINHWAKSPYVTVINQIKNSGPARARNAGLNAASGDWLAFLDADDVVAPRSIEARIIEIKRCPEMKWIVGDMLETRIPGQHSHLNSFPKAVQDGEEITSGLYKICNPTQAIADWGMLPFLGSMMIRRDLLAQAGPLKEDLIYGEDIHFCLVLSCFADLYWINRPVLYLRRYHESMTKDLVKGATEAPKASLACIQDPRLKLIKKQMRWHYAANLRQSSGVFLQHGLRLKAVTYAARAILWSPNDSRGAKALLRCLVMR